MNRPRAWWALAALLFLAAGALDTYAALLHWNPCIAVDFDTPACIEAQRDYAYYLPYAMDGQEWQPHTRAAGLAALAALTAAAGWLAIVAGLRWPGRSRVMLMLLVVPQVLSGIEALAGLGGARIVFGPGLLLSLASLAVLVGSVMIASSVVREHDLAPALVTIMALLVVNASGAPAQLVSYFAWSSFYGSFDNPPFYGLERGVLAIGAGLVIGLTAVLARSVRSPAHGAGATLERAAHR